MDSKKFLVLLVALNFVLSLCLICEIAKVNRVEEVTLPEQTTTEPIGQIEPVETVEVEPEVTTTMYRVTAYCACEKCCGKWANNRPLDENGNPIVVGAWGKELTTNFSCASPMAFGTQVELTGFGTVEVQDRTADWIVEKHGENILDIYMADHNEALEFGVQYIEGVIK